MQQNLQAPKTFSDQPPRCAFVDGFRGLTALYVVLHHAWFEVFWTKNGEWSPTFLACTKWMSLGQHGVNIFIVLSGFCLGLPLVKQRGKKFELGTFLSRRARRILPPYFAAMAITLLLIAALPILQNRTGDRWDHALPACTPASLLSHLFLVHNLDQATNWAINPPFWSIATEWQIYFIFALILVPIYRRLGILAMTLAATTCASLIHLLVPSFDQACLWFVASFAFGVAAAAVAFSDEPAVVRFRNALSWRWITRIGLAVYLFSIVFYIDELSITRVGTDLVVGLLFAVVAVDCATGQASWVKRIVESRFATKLGEFSYSLYLLHFPLLAIIHLKLRDLGIQATTRLVLMLLVAVPVAVIASYAFHLRFEKPFVRALSKQKRDHAKLPASSEAAVGTLASVNA